MAPKFYNKKQRFQRIIYKVSASGDFNTLYPPYANTEDYSDNTITPYSFPEKLDIPESALTRNAIYEPRSGSFVYNKISNPRRVQFNVSEYGKIVDVKVWVEFLHDTCGMVEAFKRYEYGVSTWQYYSSAQGNLQNTVVTLKSPNVEFYSGFPIGNCDKIAKTKNYESISRKNLNEAYAYEKLQPIFLSSYLLWVGKYYLGVNITNHGDLSYSTWNYDYHMRTIFTDSSPNSNPLHLEKYYPNASSSWQGISTHNITASAHLAPNSVFRDITKRLKNQTGASNCDWYTVTPSIPTVTGCFTPWFYDRDHWINPNLAGATASFPLSENVSAVPKGWNTGPFVAGNYPSHVDGEYQTIGRSFGPNTIKPLYPLLSDIQEVIITENLLEADYEAQGFPRIKKYDSGFRPGLKGTEVHGTWELQFGMPQDTYNNTGSYPGSGYSPFGIWFRQARLEFIVDTGEDGCQNNTIRQRYNKKSNPVREQKKLVHIMSGNLAFSFRRDSINYVYENQQEQYGRSVGMSKNTEETNFAVFSRITGSLEDNVIAMGNDAFNNLQNHFINNEFGTPYIPISSGSGVSASFNPFSEWETTIYKEMKDNLFKSKLVSETTIPATLSRAGFYKTSTNKAIEDIEKLYGFNQDDYDKNKGIL